MTAIEDSSDLAAVVPDEPDDDTAPAALHRGITLLATAGLFIGLYPVWTAAVLPHPVIGTVISFGYLGILTLALLALVVRTTTALRRVDVGVLGLAITLTACAYATTQAVTDEGALTARAAQELLAGRHVYGQPWPDVFTRFHVLVTYTMNGGADDTYAYPPLMVLIVAGLHRLLPGVAIGTVATATTTAALIAATVTLWLTLPPPWRSAATALCLGFGFLPALAFTGVPAFLALTLLVPVVVRWPEIAAGGRLRRGDIARAACLGAACAAQQQAWFVVPFLLAGLIVLRRARMGSLLGFAAIAAGTFGLLNAYVFAQSPHAWSSGLLTPFTQHGVPNGVGLIGLSYHLRAGGGALDLYAYAGLALTVAALALFMLFLRRLGPAATVLPWFAFFVTVRSLDRYFYLMAPLWLAAAATTPPRAFSHAPELVKRGTGTRIAAIALLLAPALVCATVAVATPAPLRIRITGTESGRSGLRVIDAIVTNAGSRALTPHFAISVNQSMSRFWTVRAGPVTLPRGATAAYELVAQIGGYALKPGASLRVVTDNPMTISSAPIPCPSCG
jgi:hypothetical protein